MSETSQQTRCINIAWTVTLTRAKLQAVICFGCRKMLSFLALCPHDRVAWWDKVLRDSGWLWILSPNWPIIDLLKRVCLVSWVAAPCAWMLRALTRNLLTYLLTTLLCVKGDIKPYVWWYCKCVLIVLQAAYVVHIFPPCPFSCQNLSQVSADVMHSCNELGYLLIVITTCWPSTSLHADLLTLNRRIC